MMYKMNSFPKYFIIILFIFVHCQKNDRKIINEKKFIKIYTQLFIIKEMSIENECQLFLINDL